MYMAAVTMFTACSEIWPDIYSTVTGVVISSATASVERGKSLTFTATVEGEDNPKQRECGNSMAHKRRLLPLWMVC
jgi:hypothetical protein